MRASTFVLAALLLLAIAVGIRGDACTSDLTQAGEDLGQAVASIGHAVTDCKSGNSTGCALDVEDTVEEIDLAAKAVTAAVSDCGISHNTGCATALEELTSELDAASEDATKALAACKVNTVLCVVDIIGVVGKLGPIAKDIGAAVDSCKSS